MTRNRMTLLTMLLIIPRRARTCELQLIFGIDEKTSEADDLLSVRQTTLNGRVEFALNSRLNFSRDILAALLLNVNDMFGPFLDDAFVWYGEEFAADGDDLDDVVGTVGMARAR